MARRQRTVLKRKEQREKVGGNDWGILRERQKGGGGVVFSFSPFGMEGRKLQAQQRFHLANNKPTTGPSPPTVYCLSCILHLASGGEQESVVERKRERSHQHYEKHQTQRNMEQPLDDAI